MAHKESIQPEHLANLLNLEAKTERDNMKLNIAAAAASNSSTVSVTVLNGSSPVLSGSLSYSSTISPAQTRDISLKLSTQKADPDFYNHYLFIHEDRKRMFYEMMDRAKALESQNPHLTKEERDKLMPWPFNNNFPTPPLTRGKMRAMQALESVPVPDLVEGESADNGTLSLSQTKKLPYGLVERHFWPTTYTHSPKEAAAK